MEEEPVSKYHYDVTSAKLSERLKELRVPQRTYESWFRQKSSKDTAYLYHSIMPQMGGYTRSAAFNVSELLKLLGKRFGALVRFKDSGKYGAFAPEHPGDFSIDDRPAEALGELLEKVYESRDKQTTGTPES